MIDKGLSTMAQKLVRRQGRLVMEEEQKPLTPGGAASQGATPDSAKMVGSSAQKKAVVDEAVAAPDTLAGAQRYAGPRTQLTATEEAASTKAARLSQLGGLGARVEEQVRAQFQQPLEQAQLQLSPEMLAGFSEEEQGLLSQITGAATPEEREAALVGLANARGTDTTQIQSMLQDMGVSLGTQAQEAIGLEQVTMQPELMEEFGGAEQVAADIGVTPEELAGMTVEDFEAKIDELEAQEFSQVEALKAELGSASPIRRQEILQELRALGATGITGVEKGVEDIQQQIEEADRVSFGGTEYELGDLLENDAISDAITSAVRNPEALEELRNTEPALADWIDSNKESLEGIVTDIEESQEAFRQTTEMLRDLTSGTSDTLQEAFGIDTQFMTAAQLEETQARLAETGSWQAMQENDELRQLFNERPELIGQLVVPVAGGEEGATRPMTKDEIYSAREQAKLFSDENPDSDLMKELIPGVEGDFITDTELAAEIEEVSGIVEILPEEVKSPTEIKRLAHYIKNGEITAEVAEQIAEKPELMERLRDRDEQLGEFAKIKGDTDKLLQFITGNTTMGVEEINSKYSEAKMMRRIDADASEIYKNLAALDTNRDGKIDDKDLAKLQQRVAAQIGADDSVQDLFSRGDGNLFESIQQNMHDMSMKESFNNKTAELSPYLADGKITTRELLEMTDEQVEMALKGGSDVMSQKTFVKYQKSKAARARKKERDRYQAEAEQPVSNIMAELGIPGQMRGGQLVIDEGQMKADPAGGLAKLDTLAKEIETLAAQTRDPGQREYLNNLHKQFRHERSQLEKWKAEKEQPGKDKDAALAANEAKYKEDLARIAKMPGRSTKEQNRRKAAKQAALNNYNRTKAELGG
ncbi:hypothetical protein OAF54_00055 [bacterium]|nr:hypothetical protein [bacterium]